MNQVKSWSVFRPYFLWLLEKKLEILLCVLKGGDSEAVRTETIINNQICYGTDFDRTQ